MQRELASVEPEQGHGRYHPIAELGQGGTANVYLAVARGPSSFNKLVVLKMLKSELAHESQFRTMFLNEARLAARLNHPNVVQTNEVFEVDGRPVIVMEYLEGQTLSRILARGRDIGRGGVELPLSMHLRILVDVLTGLHYSHELCDYDGTPLRVVHRDMTPHNVFVSYDGRVCILDFGIAKLTGLGIQETQTGVIKGKLRYMPPEQVLGSPLDRRADIFAVGVMLWEAAAREKMWKGLSDAAIMHNVLHGLIPSPRSVRPDVSPELERICMKALAFDKNQRYSTAAELQADLEALLSAESYANRAIGKFVSEQFAEARARMRALIESKIQGISASSPTLSSVNEWDLLPPTTISRPRLSSTSITGSLPGTKTSTSTVPSPEAHLTERPTPAEGSGRFVKGAAALLVATAVFALLWHTTKQEPSAQAPLPDASQTGSALPVAAAEPPAVPATALSPAAGDSAQKAQQEVRLFISVQPTNAQLYLDDRPLPGNPHAVYVPVDSLRHTLRAEAPGYAPETRLLSYTENATIELTLERLDRPRRDRPRTETAPQAPAQPQAPVAAPPAEEPKAEPAPAAPQGEANDKCAVPYYLDERGIRRLKRECL